MNLTPIVALLGDLYQQVQSLLAENAALRERVSVLDAEAAAQVGHVHGPDGEHV